MQDNVSYKSQEEFEEDVKSWKTGDIFLSHYPSSKHTQTVTDSPWTHVGIIYRRDDTNQFKAKYHPESELLILEALIGVFDAEFNETVFGGFIATDARHTFLAQYFRDDRPDGWKGAYAAHRPLKTPLTTKQKEALEAAVMKLEGKKYGGQGGDDKSGMGGAIDMGCCYCPCLEKAEAGTKEKALNKLFCSEASAYLLQEAGILKSSPAADEYVPKDFTSEILRLQCKGNEDPYGKEVYYG